MNSVYKLSVIGRDVMISGTYARREGPIRAIMSTITKSEGGVQAKTREALCIYTYPIILPKI